MTPQMAKAIYRYLVKSDYTGNADQITPEYYEAKSEGKGQASALGRMVKTFRS